MACVALSLVALRAFGGVFHEEDIADLLAQAEFEREQRLTTRRGQRPLRVGIDVGARMTRAVALDQRTSTTRFAGVPTRDDPGATVLHALDGVQAPLRDVELLVQATPTPVLLHEQGFAGAAFFMRGDGVVDTARAFEADPALARNASVAAEALAAAALGEQHPAREYFAALGGLLAEARYDVRQTWHYRVPDGTERMAQLEERLEVLSAALQQAIEATLGPRAALTFEDYADTAEAGWVHLRTRPPHTTEPFDLAAFFNAMKEGREWAPTESAARAALHADAVRALFHALPDDPPVQIVALRVGALAPLGTTLPDDLRR